MALSLLAVRTMATTPVESYIDTFARRCAELDAMVDDGDPIAFARVTTRAVRTVAHGSGNELLAEQLADLANQTVWTTIWKAPLDYQTREIRRGAADLMRSTLDAIRRRDVAAAVTSQRNCWKTTAIAHLHRCPASWRPQSTSRCSRWKKPANRDCSPAQRPDLAHADRLSDNSYGHVPRTAVIPVRLARRSLRSTAEARHTRSEAQGVFLVPLRRHHARERGPQCMEDRPPRQCSHAEFSGQQPVGKPQVGRR